MAKKSRATPVEYPPQNAKRVICGDSVAEVTKLAPWKFDLVFADPPFNIGQDYVGHDDRMTPAAYGAFTAKWTAACAAAVAPGGIMALHGPDGLVLPYLTAMAMTPGFHRLAWVHWTYNFGQCGRGNWIDASCHCLIFVNGRKPKTWNPDDVLIPSARVAYKDKRIHETERGGQRVPGTVWGIPADGPAWGRVQGTSAERRPGHPNQLPEVYLERLIKAYTNPGDWVLDPFGGSGTTIVVAEALRRNCVTIDVSSASCKSIEARRRKGAVRIPKG